LGLFAATLDAQERKERILAGWPGVFAEHQGYVRHYEKPKADKKAWQQTVRYEWTGGRIEMVHVTLLRDADEAKKFQFSDKNPMPEKLKKIKVGDRPAYDSGDGKLVIDLDKDRLMVLEAPTWKQFQSNLPDFAGRFSLDACAKALDQPPRTDFARKVELFRDLKMGMSLQEVAERVGDADKDIGRGIHILEYRLDDGSRVLIGFPDFKKLIYVKHIDKAGKSVDLAK
jgi:hypothetical protein